MANIARTYTQYTHTHTYTYTPKHRHTHTHTLIQPLTRINTVAKSHNAPFGQLPLLLLESLTWLLLPPVVAPVVVVVVAVVMSFKWSTKGMLTLCNCMLQAILDILDHYQ